MDIMENNVRAKDRVLQYLKRLYDKYVPKQIKSFRIILKMFLVDLREDLLRFYPGKVKALPKYNLTTSQIYPRGTNYNAVLIEGARLKMKGLKVNKEIPIASIGSCFAEEISRYLRENKFNYLVGDADGSQGSANWGRVFTIPNMRQIINYSADDKYPVYCDKSSKGWFDPLREYHMTYHGTKEDLVSAIQQHRQASRKVLSQAKILIITIGQNEAWYDSKYKIFWAVRPPQELFEKRGGDFSNKELSYEENISAFNDIFQKLSHINQTVKVILTVSPVPAYAIFNDLDVVSKAFAHKCLLRVIAEDVLRNYPDQAFYFPSFEEVLMYNPFSFKADNRHVKYKVVNKIFKIFEKVVVGI